MCGWWAPSSARWKDAEMGFFTTEVLDELVPAWLLVKRALEVEVLGRGRSLQTRVPPKRRCFSCGYFSGSLASLAGAAAWLGAEEEDVGALEGIVAQISVLGSSLSGGVC